MSKNRVVVLKIVAKQLTVIEAATQYGISWQHLHKLLARYRDGGLDAVDPRSRRPASNPAGTPDLVRDRIIELRQRLTGDGLDVGPVTIRHPHPPHNRRDPQRTPHRPHTRLLAQPTKKARPMAEPALVTVASDATHMSPMSRLITQCPWRDSNPQPFP